MSSFDSLDLPRPLLRAVEALGYTVPTPVQEQAIPLIAAGRDVAAEAQTGSGKTAAFALPVLQRLIAASSTHGWTRVRVVTLAPTRELALQVAAAFKAFGKFVPRAPKVLAVIGGEPIERQIKALSGGVDIVVATPGRLLDLVERQEIALGQVETLILDEADKLLDLGFADELAAVLELLPAERQNLLFTATLPEKVLALASRLLRDPVTVRIDPVPTSVEGIEQRVYEVDRDKRRMLLQHLFRSEQWGPTLVFVSTQRAADQLAAKLRIAGLRAAALHGGLEQSERFKALDRFKHGRISLLVATDLASRGIDVPRLGRVVNFDLARSPSDHVHRIGRTGRAGESGVAISFIDHETTPHFELIEKRTRVRVERQQVPGFELTGEAPPRTAGGAPVKGKRPSKKDKLREQAARGQAARERAAGPPGEE